MFVDWIILGIALLFFVVIITGQYWGWMGPQYLDLYFRRKDRIQASFRKPVAKGKYGWHKGDEIPKRLTTKLKLVHWFVSFLSLLIVYGVLIAKARRVSLVELVASINLLTLFIITLLSLVTTITVLHFAWRDYEEDRHFKEVMQHTDEENSDD